MNNDEKKQHVNFRIDADILEKLHLFANQNGTSLNALIDQILNDYMSWYSVAPKSGTIPFHKIFLIEILKKIENKDLVDITRNTVRSELKNTVLMFKNDFSLLACMEILETWLKMAGFPYKHEVHASQHLFTLQHDMGEKFSILGSELLDTAATLFGVKPLFEITNKTISIKIDVNVNSQK